MVKVSASQPRVCGLKLGSGHKSQSRFVILLRYWSIQGSRLESDLYKLYELVSKLSLHILFKIKLNKFHYQNKYILYMYDYVFQMILGCSMDYMYVFSDDIRL
jgi:hypothetical protein